jgi:tetratricopeptide (TPR) repeat protein
MPPLSPLITPDLRRRLQQRYEEAIRLMSQQPVDRSRALALLAECLRTDPGNILYLEALLANLRQNPRPAGRIAGWLAKWGSAGRKKLGGNENPAGTGGAWNLLCRAPEILLQRFDDPPTLRSLAAACAACDLDQAELRYLFSAREAAPNDPLTLRMLAQALTRQGRFDEGLAAWRTLFELAPDQEAERAIEDLRPAHDDRADATGIEGEPGGVGHLQLARRLRSEGKLLAAEHHFAQAQAAAGGDLEIRHEREELRLQRADQQLAVARRRALADAHPKAQALVASLEAEHNRHQIEILNLRCERFPRDMSLRMELARCLKRAGNYSGAIQRLEEARSDPALAAAVLLEMGECWQHLRQFDKALGLYLQAIAAAERGEQPQPLVAALYRGAVLAAAMNQPNEARQCLTRLVAIEPGYKDARERLDNLPAN